MRLTMWIFVPFVLAASAAISENAQGIFVSEYFEVNGPVDAKPVQVDGRRIITKDEAFCALTSITVLSKKVKPDQYGYVFAAVTASPMWTVTVSEGIAASVHCLIFAH